MVLNKECILKFEMNYRRKEKPIIFDFTGFFNSPIIKICTHVGIEYKISNLLNIFFKNNFHFVLEKL